MASAFDNLNPIFSQRLQAMIAASGGLLQPGSGFRTLAQQKVLYDNYRAGVKGQAKAAAPGRSNHNHGLAMDLVDAKTGKAVQAGSAADRWLRANAARFGLHQAVKGEAWHVELIDDDEAHDAVNGAMMIGALGSDELADSRTPEDKMHDQVAMMMATLGRGSMSADEAIEGTPPEPQQLRQDTTMVTPETGTFAPEAGLGSIPPPGYEPPGKGVERWRNVVVQALRYTGQPVNEATISLALRRMNQESGGNPRAINRWDSNAKKGDPTQGLMQNIPSAWNGRAKELAARGITDGFANIVASIRYTLGRYGSLQAGWGRRGGY